MQSDEQAKEAVPGRVGGNGFTFIVLCVGIAMVASCVLLPEADGNRELLYQTQKLKKDLDYVQRQVAANKEFVERVGIDPALRERLAQRQLKLIRKGSGVLDLDHSAQPPQSPFGIVAVAPEPMPPYQPAGGRVAALCRNSKARLYMIGMGLMLMAMGLVLGAHEARA